MAKNSQVTISTIATINVDAFLLAGVMFPALSRKIAAKLEWVATEQSKYLSHISGKPLFALAELDDPQAYLHNAENAFKGALLDLNREYHQATGRYIVQGMIKNRENLRDMIDQLMAL